MSTGGSGHAGPPPERVALRFNHEAVSRTRTRLTVFLGEIMIYRDTLNLDSATARARFTEAIVERSGAEPAQVEEQLLALAARPAEDGANEEENAQTEYQVVELHDDPERRGIYVNARGGPVQLTNFTIEIVEDVHVQDDIQSHRTFRCRAVRDRMTSEFTIAAEEYASNTRLPEAIFAAVGAKARILCKPHALRTAISAVSDPDRRTVTTNFGWTAEGDAFLVPSGRIDASGFHPASPDDPIRVDLGGEQCARHLDMRPPEPGELEPLKRHMVDDFLRLLDRRVMYGLLAAAALAVLMRFVVGKNRFALWLIGLTGGGKSFVAKLAQNLFGDFPIEEGSRVGSWSSTANFLQRQGFFFKDAIYVIDDYKYEVTRHQDVVKLLQNNADASARGRLNADATTNVSRPIRGQMVATGEDTPEHTASAVARTVVVKVASGAKDTARGGRCLERRHQYAALMVDFIRHLITEGRTRQFAARVEHFQRYYYERIEEQQNALRISGNLAQLAAAFEEIALYLGDAWPNHEQEIEWFTRHDLVALRDEMLGMVHEQQASEIFLETLATLIAHGHVRVEGYTPPGMVSTDAEHKPVIGRGLDRRGDRALRVFEISTTLAIEAVQTSLRKQGLPSLPASPKALIDQLAAEGRLLDRDNRPIDPRAGGDRTRDARVGTGPRKAFRIAADVLTGETETLHRRPQGG